MSTIKVTSLIHSGSNLDPNIGLSAFGDVRICRAITDKNGSNSSTPAQIEQGRAKAWVHYDNKTSMSVLDSYNVDYVADNATGEATVNFSTAMANANYVVCGTTSESLTSSGHFDAINFHTFTTSAVDVESFGSADSPDTEKDNDINCVIVFGD